MAGMVEVLLSLFQETTEGRVVTLLPKKPPFAFRVAGDGDLYPIWEAVAREKVTMEGLVTLNQNIMRGLPSCR